MTGAAPVRRVLLTGALGLLGRETARVLAQAGLDVTALDLRAETAAPGVATVADDLSSRPRLEALLGGIDAVVHLAALAHLHVAREDIVYTTNVATTANLLFAAEAAGVARFVQASSQSALGLPYAPRVIAPDYLPVDEAHPCRPLEGYGLSKIACEGLCAMVAARSAMRVVSLRFPVIWSPLRFAEHTGKRLGDPAQAAKSLWAYVDVRDAARGCLAALGVGGTGHDIVNITAPWPFLAQGDSVPADAWYGADVPRRGGWEPRDAAFAPDKARRLLGFSARWRWSPAGIADAGEREEAAHDSRH